MPVISVEERFSAALHSTARSWRQALDRRLKDLGVSQAAWMAIATIAKAQQPLSQTELADRLAVETPTMVAMIDRLAKAGFVQRAGSETDRRVKLVVLTDAGSELFAKVKTEAAAFRKELLSGVDRKQLQVLTDLLESLQEKSESAL